MTTLSKEDEIKAAKSLLRGFGYWVIPREKVATLSSIKAIDDRTLLGVDSRPDFIRAIHRDIYMRLVDEIGRTGLSEVTSHARDSSGITEFRAQIQIIPHNIAVDPMVELLRESIEGKPPK